MSMVVAHRLLAALALAHALAFPAAQAQTPPADPAEGAIKLDLSKAEAQYGGKLLWLQGQAVKGKPVKFSLEGLFVMQPVVVSLLTRPQTAGIELAAFKPFVKTPAKAAVTNAQGHAEVSFRVQGDAIIQVTGTSTGTPFQMMLWVGPELREPMASPFQATPADALRAAKGAVK